MSSDEEEPQGPLAPLPPRRAAPPPSAFPARQPSFGTDAASALVALSAIGAAAATEQQWLAAPPTADAATRSEGGEEADTRSEGGEEAEGRRSDLVSYQPPHPRPSPSPNTRALTRILTPKPETEP